jgi:6-phosphogluconolactonase
MQSVEVRKAVNAIDVATQAAEEIVSSLASTLKAKPSANVALTGGTVGILTLEVLARDEFKDQIDFSKVHFWWGDERYVAGNSNDRNANQARVALLNTLAVDESNIHEFPSTDSGLSVDEARDKFEQYLLDAFHGESPVMDLTILGMGPDGHVASLFPGMVSDSKNVVAIHNSPKPPAERLSLSMDVINASKKIIFVVSGIDKAEAVEAVHKDPDCELPAAKVAATGLTLWIIDEAAGASFWSC